MNTIVTTRNLPSRRQKDTLSNELYFHIWSSWVVKILNLALWIFLAKAHADISLIAC